MKDFKHTHKMHHGAHPMFGGSSARPSAPAMPPMMPPGGMGGIQSAGEDMASSAPGGMGGMGAPAGGAPDGSGNSAGAGYRRGGKVRHYAEGSEGGVDVTNGLGSRRSFLQKKADQPLGPKVTQSLPSGLFDEGYPLDVKISNDDDLPHDYFKKAKGGMAKGGNWIKDATKNKGALHRSLGVPMGQKIPMSKIKKAEKSSDPKLAKRARLAETLRGFKK
jgi:hypothetical protein